jgi:branched-chain amino acid transport system substrate-binding protein
MHVRTLQVAGVLVALLATACGGADSGGGSGKLKGTYKIGVFGPAQVPQGVDIRDAAELAAEELNARDGAGGRKVQIVFCDSDNGAKPEKAIACAERFAQEDRVDAVVGGFSSGETLAMLDTVVKAELPFVATGAASPDVVKDVDNQGDRRVIFRIGPINSRFLAADMCLTVVTKIAGDTGFTKFGILYEDVEFARPLVEFLRACLKSPKAATEGKIPLETGVDLVRVEKHLPDATDFSSQFRALEQAGAQYVIEVNSRQEGVALVKQWGQLKPKFALGGINVASQANEFFDATGGAANFQLNGPAGIVRAPLTPKTIPFFDAFKAKFNRDPIYNGASTYDAVFALAEAVASAGSAKSGDVVTALAKMDRVGVQGREKFDESHDIVYGAGKPDAGLNPIYFQWRDNGERKIVYPTTLAEGNKYILPDWLK